jgi:hypothetical protein
MVQDQPSAGEGQQGVVARHVIANAGVGLDFRVGIVDNLNVAIVAGLVLGDGGNVVVGGDCLHVLDHPEKVHTRVQLVLLKV